MEPKIITRSALAARWSMTPRTLVRLERTPPARFPTKVEMRGRFYYRMAEIERYERSYAGVAA